MPRKAGRTPQHGIGRSCKAGKEEIVGLLTALKLFIAEGDAARHARWLKALREIEQGVAGSNGVSATIEGADDQTKVPVLVLKLNPATHQTTPMLLALQSGDPSIHADPTFRDKNQILINPMCLQPHEPALVAAGLKRVLRG